MTNDYWLNRALSNEAFAAKYARSAGKRLKALNKQVYNKLETELDALLYEVEKGNILSRSDLWRSKHYISLRNAINEEMHVYARGQIDIVQYTLSSVFESTIKRTMDDFKKAGITFSGITEQQKQQLINSQWLGSDFSKRVWHNTDALADKLNNKMCAMILTGRDVRRELMDEMKVSFSVADRLVRTESAHIYTEAAKKTYQEANIEKVRFIAEADCRDDCAQYSGKEFALSEAPLIPLHCNCRCCLAPVVDLSK